MLKTLTGAAQIGHLGRKCASLTRKFGYLRLKVNFFMVIAIFVNPANHQYARGYNFPILTTPKKNLGQQCILSQKNTQNFLRDFSFPSYGPGWHLVVLFRGYSGTVSGERSMVQNPKFVHKVYFSKNQHRRKTNFGKSKKDILKTFERTLHVNFKGLLSCVFLQTANQNCICDR